MAPVLIAMQDRDLRGTLRLILEEEAGYPIAEAHDGVTTLTALWKSPSPLVVLLDAHLGEQDDAEQVLRMAAVGGSPGRHRYVLCTTIDTECLAPRLTEVMTTVDAIVLLMPFDLDELLRVVARAQTLSGVVAQPCPAASVCAAQIARTR